METNFPSSGSVQMILTSRSVVVHDYSLYVINLSYLLYVVVQGVMEFKFLGMNITVNSSSTG